MRKKEQYIVKGATGTALAFVIIDGLNQHEKLQEEGKPFWANLDTNRSFKAGVYGLIIGGALGYTLYKIQQWQEKDLLFCPDNHLHQALNFHNAQGDPVFVAEAKKLTSQLKEELAFEFGDELVYKPLDFGSSKTKTAVGGISDFDILVPFKKRAGTMINLYDAVHQFMVDRYDNDYFEVRSQRHSIGLTYDDGTTCIHTDIVPARERNNFQETGDVTIIRVGKGLFERHKHLKSNIWLKRGVLVNQPETRRLIKLTKIYKGEASLYLKSPVIVSLVKEAMEKNQGYISSSIYDNWTLALTYVADQLQNRVRLKDIANSNNNLLESMSQSERNDAVNLISSDLEKLGKSPRYLNEIFRIG